MAEEKSGRGVLTYRVVQTVCVVLTVIAALVSANILLNPTLPRPVSAYKFPVIDLSVPAHCPGDQLSYEQVLSVTEAPAVVIVVDSVWSIDDQRSVVPDEEAVYVNYTVPTTVTYSGEWTIPELRPGHYERRVSNTSFGRKPEIFTLLFVVGEGCPT